MTLLFQKRDSYPIAETREDTLLLSEETFAMKRQSARHYFPEDDNEYIYADAWCMSVGSDYETLYFTVQISHVGTFAFRFGRRQRWCETSEGIIVKSMKHDTFYLRSDKYGTDHVNRDYCSPFDDYEETLEVIRSMFGDRCVNSL